MKKGSNKYPSKLEIKTICLPKVDGFKIILNLSILFLTFYAKAQSPIYFSSANYANPNSTVQASAAAMSTLTGQSISTNILTTTPNGTGTQKFSFYSATSAGTHYAPSGSDVALTSGTSSALASGGSNNYYLTIANAASNVVFKTSGSGAPGTSKVVAFEVQGAVQSVSSVSQVPTVANGVNVGQIVTVTATLSGSLSTGQGVWIRYTTNGYTSSTVAAMSGSGTTYTATIPAATNTANAAVSYYVFTSSSGTGPNSGGTDADLFAINLNNNSGSYYTYTVGATTTTYPYISAQTGNYGTASTWLGGVVPPSGATVQIANTHTVTLNQAATIAALTINNTATFSTSNNTLTVNAAGTITNNGAFTSSNGTVNFSGSATVAGSNACTFQNVTINTGTITLTTVPTINGTLLINGGSLSAGPIYGASSTINYATTYSRGNEWTASSGTIGTTAGYPNNVTVSSGTLDIANGTTAARSINGALTISTGATASMGAMTGQLSASNVSIGGTLALSTAAGGDLAVSGTNPGTSSALYLNGGTFTTNGRVLYMASTGGTQNISSLGNTTVTISYLAFSSATITSNRILNPTCPLTITATGGSGSPNAITFYYGSGLTNSDYIYLYNGCTLFTLGTVGTNPTIGVTTGTNGYIKAGSVSNNLYSMTINGNTSSPGTINNITLDNGNGATYLNNLTINGVNYTAKTGPGTGAGPIYIGGGTSGSLSISNGSVIMTSSTMTLSGSMSVSNGYIDATTNSSTIKFNGGAQQTLPSGLFYNNNCYNLIDSCSSGLVLGGNLNITHQFTQSIGNLTVGANTLSVAGLGTYTAGSVDASNANATVQFTNASAMTLNAGFFTGNVNNLTMNGAGGVTLGAATTVAGTLTLTNGKLATTASNLLTISNTSNTAISGGSTSSYVNGPLSWTLPTNGSASTYTYPVGNTTYLPFALISPTGTGALTATVQAFTGSASGTPDNSTVTAVSANEYWSFSTTGTFTGGSVSLTKQSAISPYNTIGVSSTSNGTYSYLGGTVGTNGVTASNNIGSSTPRYFLFATQALVPTITSITAASPITGQTTGNGYIGQTVNIVGTNFTASTTITFNGASAVSVTFTNSTTISAVIPGGSTSGTVTANNPGPITGTYTGYNVLGYLSIASSDWNTTSTWAGGVVPLANIPVTINTSVGVTGTVTNTASTVTITSGSTLSVSSSGALTATTLTNNGTLSISAGSLTATTLNNASTMNMSGTGSVTTTTFTNTGTMTMSASGATLNISANGSFINNNTFTGSNGTVNFLGIGSISGTSATQFANLTINTGLLTLTTIPTINGTLTINGGSLSAAPKYTSASTLSYATSIGRGNEWNAVGIGTIGTTAGYPNNVTVTNSSTLDVANGDVTDARAINGAMTIASGSTVSMGALTARLTVSNVSIGGTLTLSTAAGGDLAVTGTGTSSNANSSVYLNGGTFTTNGRILYLSATSGNQYLTNATPTSPITISYLAFDANATGQRQCILNSPLIIAATGGSGSPNAITYYNGYGSAYADFIILYNTTTASLTIGTLGTNPTIGVTNGTLGYIKGSSGGSINNSLTIYGNTASPGTINNITFDNGNTFAYLNSLTLNGVNFYLTSGTAGGALMSIGGGSAGGGTLNVSNGSLIVSSGGMNVSASTISVTNANIDATTNSPTITFNGVGASQTIPSGLFSSNSCYRLGINNSNGVSMGGSLTVPNYLLMTSGKLTVAANTLSIGGLTYTSGNVDASNAGSTFIFANGAQISLPSGFFSGNVNNLTLNGAGVTLGSPTTVANTLTLTGGVLNNTPTNNLTILNGGTIVRNSSSSVISLPPVFGTSSTHRVNVTIGVSCTSGNELLGTTGQVGTLTVNGTYTYTLSGSTISGYTITSGGLGYSTASGISGNFSAPTSTGTNSTASYNAIISNGAITSLAIYNAGLGYIATPTVTIPNPNASAWAANTNYSTNYTVTNGGNVYVCTVSGKSAASGGPTGTGSGIVDNSITWNYLGAATSVATATVTYQTTNALTVDALNINGTLTYPNNGSPLTLTINNNLTVGATGTVTAGTQTNAVAHLMYLGGSLINSGGTFTMTGSGVSKAVNVTLNGSSNQSIGSAFFNSLIMSNSTGANLTASVSVANVLNLSTGNLTVGANTLTLSGSSPTGTASVDASNGSATVLFTNTSAITLPSTFFLSNTVNNLTLNGAGGVILGATTSVTGTLTLTSGTLTSTSSNLLTISNTANSGISGGSTTSYIKGPANWVLPSGGSSSTYTFPVGSSTTYYPFALSSPSGTGTYSVTVQAFSGSTSGTVNTTLTSISNTEYWAFTTSGSFTGGTVSLTRQLALSTLNCIGVSTTTLGGVYSSLAGTASTYSVTGSNNIGSNATQYFVFGVLSTNPVITSITAISPITNQTASGNGYIGQTVTIAGSGFVSGATVTFNGASAISTTFGSSSSLTAVIPGGSTSGTVTVTNPNTVFGTYTGYNVLGYLSIANTDWNTATTWAGGVVPLANVNVTINNAVTVTSAVTNTTPNLIINTSGNSLTFSSTGSLTATTVTNNGTISMSGTSTLTSTTFNNSNAFTLSGSAAPTITNLANTGTTTFGGNSSATITTLTNGGTVTMSASGATLNMAASGSFTNNSTVTATAGTVNFVGAGTVNGSNATTFNNLTLNTGTLTLSTVPTINGTFTINGGSVSAAPIYTSSSTLLYAVSYGRGTEWNATGAGTIGTTAGYPNNVTLSGTATLDIPNGTNGVARAINGTLTVGTGCTAAMNAMTTTFTVGGVANSGTLTLSSASGGNLFVTGNFTNNGTFTANGRIVTFNGTSAQTLTGSTTFDYLTLNNGSGLTLGTSTTVTLNNTLTLSNGTMTVAGNTLNIGKDISVSSGNINASNTGATVVFNSSTASQSIPSGTFTGNVNNLTDNNTNVGGLTLNQSITTNSGSTLLIGSSSLFTIPNGITLTIGGALTQNGSLTINGTSASSNGGTNNGTLILSGSGTPTLNGTLTVNGYFKNAGSGAFVYGTPTITFGPNSVYELASGNINATVPYISSSNPSWNAASTVLVSNANSGIAIFGSGAVLGNVSVTGSASGSYFIPTTNGYNLTIVGNLSINESSNNRFYLIGSATPSTGTIQTFNVNGDVNIQSNTQMVIGAGAYTGCLFTFNFAGNFTALTGALNNTTTGLCSSGFSSVSVSQNVINLTGTGKYISLSTGVFPAYCIVNVNGSYSIYTSSVNANTFNVNGSLYFYDNTNTAYSVSGVSFTVSNGATVYVNSPTGLNGSVTSSTRSFGIATYEFDAPATASSISAGTYLPSTVLNLIINNASGVSLSNSSLTVNNALTITSGTLSQNGETINMASGATLTNNGGGLATTGTNGADGGTVNFLGTGTVNGTSATTFYNLSVSSGTTTLSASPTINGTFTINTGGAISGFNPYYGTSSTLFYNATTYNRSIEWATGTTSPASAGYPNNVTIGSSSQASAVNLMNSGALQLGGNLSIGATSGSSSSLTMNDATTPNPLTVKGNVSILATGTLVLGNSISGNTGDLYVAGNFTRTGTFTPNSRVVYFNGTTAQTLTGATTFDNLTLNNSLGSSGGLTLASSSAVTINQTLSLTSGLLTTSNSNLTIANTGSVSGGSTSAYVNGPLIAGMLPNLSGSGTFNYPVGNAGVYLPVSLQNVTTGATGPFITITAINSGSGGSADAVSISAISSTEYWSLKVVSGNFSGATINVSRQAALGALNLIAKSTTLTGTYTSIGGVVSGTTINGISNPGSGSVNSGSTIYLLMATGEASPTITTVTPYNPTIAAATNNTGYIGQTLNIIGTNFNNTHQSLTVGGASVSFTYISSTNITAVVPASSLTGSIVVTNTSTYNYATAGFTQLGYISNANNSWNNSATWLGNGVPVANATVTINSTVTIPAAVTNAPNTLTINSGNSLTQSSTLTVNNTLTNNGTYASNASASVLTMAAGSTFTNNGTTSLTSGTVSFAGSGTINGTTGTSFNNLTINTGTITVSTTPTITGTLTINGGSLTAAPIYGSSSTLLYNTTMGRGNEWNANGIGTIGTTPGYPNNVTVSNSASIDLANGSLATPRAMLGTLTINSGTTVSMGAMTAPLTSNNVSLAGTLTLSTASGGDLSVTGNNAGTLSAFYLNGGTFNANGRALYLSATGGGQYLTNAAGTALTFPYIVFNNNGTATRYLSLTGPLVVSAPSGGNAITFYNGYGTGFTSVYDYIGLNGYTLTIGTVGVNPTIGVTTGGTYGIIKASGSSNPTSNLIINGNTSSPGSLGNNLSLDIGSGANSLNQLTTNGVNFTLNAGANIPNSPNIGGGTGGALSVSNGSLIVGSGGLNIQGTMSVSNASVDATTNSPTVTLNGSAAQTVPANFFSSNNCYKLVINNSNGITLGGNVNVTNNLTLTSGIVTTGSNTLTLSVAAGTVSTPSASSYISGKLAQTFTSTGSRTYPIGKGGNYIPVTFNYTSLTGTPSIVTAEQFETSLSGTLPAGTNAYNTRYWSFYQSGATAFGYKVTIDVTGYSPTGASVVMLKQESGTITSNATTFSTPYYTNSSPFTTMAGTVNLTLGSNCTSATTASAGANQTSTATCNLTTVTLAANTPTYGTGLWSVVSGTGGSFANNTSPTSTFSGVSGNAYQLQWAVTNGNCSANSTTNVTFNALPTTVLSYAGTPFCSNGSTQSATLSSSTGTPFTSTSYASTAGLTINGSTGVITPTTSTVGGPYTVTYSFTGSNGCTNSTTTQVSVQQSGLWNGSSNNLWSNASNWGCTAVPTTTTNVTLPTGLTTYPLITGSFPANNLTIASGASLTVTGTLQMYGTLSNSGTLDITAGTLEMDGGSAQTIPGSSFVSNTLKNLTINNASGVTLGGSLTLTGFLTPTSGTLNLSNYNITLQSNVTTTAQVAQVPSANTTPFTYGTGRFVVQRYITSLRRGYRNISSGGVQTDQSMYYNWQEGGTTANVNPNPGFGMKITGVKSTTSGGVDPTTGLDYNLTGNPSLFTYNTSDAFVAINQASGGTINKMMLPIDGYYALVRGDRSLDLSAQSPPLMVANTTLRTTGKIATGTVLLKSNANPSFTISGGTASSSTFRLNKNITPNGQDVNNYGYSLVANPYPCAINWNTIYTNTNTTSSTISPYYWAWNQSVNSNAGGWITVDNSGNSNINAGGAGGTGASGGTSYNNNWIQPGQSFFIKNNNSGSDLALEIKESDKWSTDNSKIKAVFGTQAPADRMLFQLSRRSGSDTILADGAFVRFAPNFSNAIDMYDAAKYENTADNIGIDRSSTLSIECRQEPTLTDTLPLKLWKVSTDSSYTLTVSGDGLQSALQPYVFDKFNSTKTPLPQSGALSIDFVPTSDTNSYMHRFSIVYGAGVVLPDLFVQINGQRLSNGNQINWIIAQIPTNTTSNFVVERSVDGIHFDAIATVPVSGKTSFEYVDANQNATTTYYRIAWTNVNGNVYSKTVSISSENKPSQVKVFPTLIVGGHLEVQLSNMPKGMYTLSLYNALGQQATTLHFNHTGGNSLQTIQLSQPLAHGAYTLEISNSSGKVTNLTVEIQ